MALDPIRGRRPIAGAERSGPARVGSSGFFVPMEGAGAAETAAAAGTMGVSASALLALQSSGPEPAGDRPARRRGHDMLDELAALQRDLLAPSGPAPGTLRRLATLADAVPEADDPGLREAVEAIRMRAVVELARYGLMD